VSEQGSEKRGETDRQTTRPNREANFSAAERGAVWPHLEPSTLFLNWGEDNDQAFIG
jgi:hypothetical protein